eukprot:GHUV01031521.1.p1 GENE.GHUV01031521.1~~GHUV01031521.1.p1  ORF type:complete len:130 (+),score=5.54 GHUV01031521.1:686-1075(+)
MTTGTLSAVWGPAFCTTAIESCCWRRSLAKAAIAVFHAADAEPSAIGWSGIAVVHDYRTRVLPGLIAAMLIQGLAESLPSTGLPGNQRHCCCVLPAWVLARARAAFLWTVAASLNAFQRSGVTFCCVHL